jgi:hypothetical protein
MLSTPAQQGLVVANSQHMQQMGTHIGVGAPSSYVDALVGSSPLDLDLFTNVLLLCSPGWSKSCSNMSPCSGQVTCELIQAGSPTRWMTYKSSCTGWPHEATYAITALAQSSRMVSLPMAHCCRASTDAA